MSQNMRATPGYSPRHGRSWNVDGSGRAIMSLSCTRAKPSMAEPSKPMPSANAPSSSAGATATDLSEPSTAVNQSRTKRMSRSSSVRSTNSSCLSTGITLNACRRNCVGQAPKLIPGAAGQVTVPAGILGRVSCRLRSGDQFAEAYPVALPGAWDSRPGGRRADEQQRRVVVRWPADVMQQVIADQVEQVRRGAVRADLACLRQPWLRLRREGLDPLIQRVELPARVAGLGDAVGVQEQLIVRLKGEDLLRPGVAAEPDEAERRGGRAHLEHGHAVFRRDQEGRRVTAVEYGQLAPVRVDLGEQGGHELLVLAPAARQARVKAVGDLVERADPMGDLAEPADDVRRYLDRAESLAAHVADDQPDAVRVGVRHLVQVAAHPRLGGGGQVDDAELQRAELLGKRPQDGALRGFRDRADVGELLVLLLLLDGSPAVTEDGASRADHGRDRDRARRGERQLVCARCHRDAAPDDG